MIMVPEEGRMCYTYIYIYICILGSFTFLSRNFKIRRQLHDTGLVHLLSGVVNQVIKTEVPGTKGNPPYGCCALRLGEDRPITEHIKDRLGEDRPIYRRQTYKAKTDQTDPEAIFVAAPAELRS